MVVFSVLNDVIPQGFEKAIFQSGLPTYSFGEWLLNEATELIGQYGNYLFDIIESLPFDLSGHLEIGEIHMFFLFLFKSLSDVDLSVFFFVHFLYFKQELLSLLSQLFLSLLKFLLPHQGLFLFFVLCLADFTFAALNFLLWFLWFRLNIRSIDGFWFMNLKMALTLCSLLGCKWFFRFSDNPLDLFSIGRFLFAQHYILESDLEHFHFQLFAHFPGQVVDLDCDI